MSGHDWRDEAVCAQIGGDVAWFPAVGESSQTAKRICSTCPVRLACLESAMRAEGRTVSHNFRSGIYGGLPPSERAHYGRGLRGNEVRLFGDGDGVQAGAA